MFFVLHCVGGILPLIMYITGGILASLEQIAHNYTAESFWCAVGFNLLVLC
jgi:hypothetical protein